MNGTAIFIGASNFFKGLTVTLLFTVLTACGAGVDDPLDTMAPEILLNGDATITIHIGGTYTEQGATAIDDVDGTVTVETTGSVNTVTLGDYTLTYTASDDAGNRVSTTRIVTVADLTFQRIIISDDSGGNIVIYDTSAQENIDSAPMLEIPFNTGDADGLTYDPVNDVLYVTDYDESLNIYDDFSAADNTTVPSRTVTESNVGFTESADTSLDTDRELLYVVDDTRIVVFNNLNTINGDVTPSAEITGLTNVYTDSRVVIDQDNDRLYVVTPECNIHRIENASSASGAVTPDAELLLNGCTFIWGASLDVSRDILYIADQTGGTVNIIDNISTLLTSTINADRTITGDTTTMMGPGELVINSWTNRLYVADADGWQILVWNNASTVDGDVAPSWSIDSVSSELGIMYDIELY